MKANLIIKLLSGKGSINYNKTIAKLFGIDAAILLGELCFKYDYWSEQDRLTEDGYFYCTQEDIEEDTCLSPYQQREALKKLAGIVYVSKRGLPAKNHFFIDTDALERTVEALHNGVDNKSLKNCTTSGEGFSQQVMQHTNSQLESSKSLTTSDENLSQQEVKDFNTTNKRELIKETIERENKQTEVPSVCIDEVVVDDTTGVYVEEKNNTSIEAPRVLSWPEFNEAVKNIIPDYSTTHNFYNYCVLNNLHKIDTSMPDWRSIYTGWQAARQC